MSDLQWEAFRRKGGAEWLRELLDGSREMITVERLDRERRILADSKTMTTQQLAEKYGMHYSSIWRITR